MESQGEDRKEVSIVGLGSMGGAIAKSLARRGYDVHGYDLVEAKMPKHVQLYDSLEALLDKKLPLVVAVKPNQVKEVLSRVGDQRLVISIAAGVSVDLLKKARSAGGPVIRVMPNTPFQVGEGVSALFADPSVSEDDRQFALELFSTGGEAFFIPKEEMIHAITGVSGSGPAFVQLFMQAMEDAGVYLGLPREMARTIVCKTVTGTGKLVEKSGRSPQENIHDVTSPGGTTIHGLHTLKDFSLERAVQRAIRRAAERSQELGG